MEAAIIDWKSIDSRFVKDDLYEHINAPKWIDFSAPDDPIDDEAWFCRPSCNHPKTVDDFFGEKERTPVSNSKLQRSASVSDIPPFGDRNQRDATLKKRGITQPFGLSNKDTHCNRVVEDDENQDPNFSTPPNHKANKVGKQAIKSSTERKQINDTNTRKVQTRKLKSTLSARNLFSGGDILNKVAEFYNELKNMATRGRDKENAENVEKLKDKDHMDDDMNEKEKERKPLLEMSRDKSEVMGMSGSKGKLRRKKRNDDAENTPISVDVKNIKGKGLAEEGLLQIRTCPPTPQCFSATRETPKSTTIKPFRPRPMECKNQERGILQEVKQINKEMNDKKNNGGGEVAEKEARSLDVFWFLKPCTLSS